MWKKASICSSERPLVSGTQQPVKSRLSRQMAEKKKKGTWRPKAFCSRELGKELLSVHSLCQNFKGSTSTGSLWGLHLATALLGNPAFSTIPKLPLSLLAWRLHSLRCTSTPKL